MLTVEQAERILGTEWGEQQRLLAELSEMERCRLLRYCVYKATDLESVLKCLSDDPESIKTLRAITQEIKGGNCPLL